MRTPTDKAYRVPTWMIVFFLLANIFGLWIAIHMLQSRAKHAWPW